ncbi:tRNA 2-selenouridine(34) synthase MnmH [bacterium]|jgi:tRNA 2-selenouridine synthase|nr:tRNA 2-selenouridine(34) synthase MnmH [bacterium]
MKKKTIDEIIKFANKYTLIDVRAPEEFKKGHIPLAQNIPLFSDLMRKLVGIEYKQKGRESAISFALENIGSTLPSLVEKAKKLGIKKPFCIYCARGGMRSSSMAWLFDLFGLNTTVIIGGYKKFRNWTIKQFDVQKKVTVLGGKTGSGKTQLLKYFKNNEKQVVDLEKLAQHKGSVFGGDKNKQKTQQQFENDLALEWFLCNPVRPIWIEDESRKIGSVTIPEGIWLQMQNAKVYFLQTTQGIRTKNIIKEYGTLDKNFLLNASKTIYNQLGDQKYRCVVDAIKNDSLERACKILLDYYDKKYEFGIQKKKNVHYITKKQLLGEIGI